MVLAGAVLLSGWGSVKGREKGREGVGKEISLSGRDRAVPFDIAADQYYLPLGEGKRVPADSGDWIHCLEQQEVQVMERLSMPFLASAMGEYSTLGGTSG